MSVFDKRIAFKPFEYPEVTQFRDAINHSYWLVSEWNFISDVNDYHTKLNPIEKNVVRHSILAISQIEVEVKKFWRQLGDRFPKAEFDQVGTTFGESEVRHAEAYSHLLQILGLNEDFSHLVHKPAIQKRVEYLQKYLKNVSVATVEDRKKFMNTLSLFSLFIENVSLFSQFAIIKSYNKHRNLLKDIDNVIQATQLEEQLHAKFGAWLVNQIKSEFPHWFDEDFSKELKKACNKAFKAECGVLDWIFEEGEPDFLSKEALIEFLKDRFNESLMMVGEEPMYEVDNVKLKSLQWFNDEINSEVNTDFFHKKPVTYSKKQQSIRSEDLF